jgi:hypothetical protein
MAAPPRATLSIADYPNTSVLWKYRHGQGNSCNQTILHKRHKHSPNQPDVAKERKKGRHQGAFQPVPVAGAAVEPLTRRARRGL